MPVWDVVFGTFNHPGRCSASEFGLRDAVVPRNFFSQLWFPFKAQIQPPLPLEPTQ